MGWRDALNGALDVLAPGSPSATTEVEADGDFFTRLDRHWLNAYAELGTPPRDVETGYTSRDPRHVGEAVCLWGRCVATGWPAPREALGRTVNGRDPSYFFAVPIGMRRPQVTSWPTPPPVEVFKHLLGEV
ncbi:hypothetical protein [Streptomyces sp. NPDC005407]|uniref:hypothetical protein n=1 Tax=Streptomyces sp. NPDC005407 TaxID=3155340 RepID=UPI0033B307B6